ncbi:MAG: hypothetical protein ACPGNT_03450 [Rhodospirillales bacterium]
MLSPMESIASTPDSPKNTKALVALALGDNFQTAFERAFRPTWEVYAARHGYDIVVLTEPLDGSERAAARAPHWQKCLILEHERVRPYEHAVLVDADVSINPQAAPCIVEANGGSPHIGMISWQESYRSTPAALDKREGRFHRAPSGHFWQREDGDIPPTSADYYARCGYDIDPGDWTNGGVLVMQPGLDEHRRIMRAIYENHDEVPFSSVDNLAICVETIGKGAWNAIDPRFNLDLGLELVANHPHVFQPGFKENKLALATAIACCWLNAYFLHFVGSIRSFRPYALMIPQILLPAKNDRDALARLAAWGKTQGLL